MKKTCNICNLEKELIEFYVNKGMKDGYQNRCISCTKQKSKERDLLLRSNPKTYEKYKERHREKYHRLNYKEKHKPSFESKKKAMENYKGKYPEKYKSRLVISNIKRDNPNSHLHHWSYNDNDLRDIIELSKEDHYLLHRYIKYDQDIKMYRSKITNSILDSKQLHLDLLELLKQMK